MRLFDLFFPQVCKSDMSKYGISQNILESPLEFEITRVDCILKSDQSFGSLATLSNLIDLDCLLTVSALVNIFSRRHFEIDFLFFPENRISLFQLTAPCLQQRRFVNLIF